MPEYNTYPACCSGILQCGRYSPNCDRCSREGCRNGNSALDPAKWVKKAYRIEAKSGGETRLGISHHTYEKTLTLSSAQYGVTNMILTEASSNNYYHYMQSSNPLGCDKMGSDCGVNQLGQSLV